MVAYMKKIDKSLDKQKIIVYNYAMVVQCLGYGGYSSVG